jgi:hypothetical protein
VFLHFAQRITGEFFDDDKTPRAFEGGKLFAATGF